MRGSFHVSPHRASAICVRGVTLVEFLVTMGIIMILTALGLPAVQHAREAARRAECANRLRNLGVAALSHEAAHSFLPSDGWGYRWVGDPDRGIGSQQPGGWIFNLLPYLEMEDVYGMGNGQNPQRKSELFAERFSYAFEVFYCPSRRASGTYPYMETSFKLANSKLPRASAKTDYAINAGSVEIDGGPGPTSAHDLRYVWPNLRRVNGVSFVRSQVRATDVRDGMSRTILAGEKHVPINSYLTGNSIGDDQGIYIGDDADIRRFSVVSPQRDTVVSDPREGRLVHAFGSAHPSSTQFVMCDGSLKRISFDIDLRAFQLLGGRHDGGRSYQRR